MNTGAGKFEELYKELDQGLICEGHTWYVSFKDWPQLVGHNIANTYSISRKTKILCKNLANGVVFIKYDDTPLVIPKQRKNQLKPDLIWEAKDIAPQPIVKPQYRSGYGI